MWIGDLKRIRGCSYADAYFTREGQNVHPFDLFAARVVVWRKAKDHHRTMLIYRNIIRARLDGLGTQGRKFLGCCMPVVSRSRSSTSNIDVSGFDQSQIDQLEDRCILVDEEDRILGSSSKVECHLAKNRAHVLGDESPGGLLHRAFSVLLFNSRNELLLQQRSKYKITFPEFYTNTCCSHPRATNLEMNDAEHVGVKIAAQRRLNFELGIPLDQVRIMKILFLV